MPFRSKKQRNYLKREEPGVYKRWKKKYGTKIRPKKPARRSRKR